MQTQPDDWVREKYCRACHRASSSGSRPPHRRCRCGCPSGSSACVARTARAQSVGYVGQAVFMQNAAGGGPEGDAAARPANAGSAAVPPDRRPAPAAPSTAPTNGNHAAAGRAPPVRLARGRWSGIEPRVRAFFASFDSKRLTEDHPVYFRSCLGHALIQNAGAIAELARQCVIRYDPQPTSLVTRMTQARLDPRRLRDSRVAASTSRSRIWIGEPQCQAIDHDRDPGISPSIADRTPAHASSGPASDRWRKISAPRSGERWSCVDERSRISLSRKLPRSRPKEQRLDDLAD